MTPLQKATIRASEIRSKLAALGGAEELTDEQTTEIEELRNEYQTVETRVQALTVAEDEPTIETRGEDRQLAELIGGSSIGAIFSATLEHRATDGRTAELQTELGLAPNQIPLALLRSAPRMEERAVTPAPGNVGATQAEIIPGVFPMSCAAFLGIDMPTVATGEAVFPVLTQNAVVGVPAENAIPSGTGIDSEGATTGAFSAEMLSGKRLQAAFFYSREDRARFAGMDSALRMNLSDALADKLDQQILNGAEGLFNGTNLGNNNVSAVTSYALYKSGLAYGRVDGTWASTVGDLRIVMGSGTFAHAATQYRGNNADQSAADELMAKTAGVKVSAHVPAVAASKQNAVIRLGMRRDMVAPIWEGVTLIPDEVTKASSGQIVVTAVMLHAVKILRSGGFHKQQTQHA